MSFLEIENLNMHFPIFGGLLRKQVGSVYAVNDVNFSLEKGQTIGVVGESGCGKTTLGRAIVRLYQPTSGKVIFDGEDIANYSRDQLIPLSQRIQMIFQDPYASLNPRMTIKDALIEPLNIHKRGTKSEKMERIASLMETVGLRADDLSKFPHEFSGGQRQRIGIARSLTLNPDLIIADEPVSALDVSIQSQVLNLLNDLQEKLGLTYIFVSHDLTVVKYISDIVVVMYLGHVVEIANSEDIYKNPKHPYTRALLSVVPIPDPDKRESRFVLKGDVPSPSSPPKGCPFNTRCPYAESECFTKMPELKSSTEDKTHKVKCHFAEESMEKPLSYVK